MDEAYGETRYAWGDTPTSFRFTGQREDDTIGLYYYNARYYDPMLGRFIQADTIVPNPSDPQDLNRYSYVGNNPIRYTDPSGHCRRPGECVVLGLGGEPVTRDDLWFSSPLAELWVYRYTDSSSCPMCSTAMVEWVDWMLTHPGYEPENDPFLAMVEQHIAETGEPWYGIGPADAADVYKYAALAEVRDDGITLILAAIGQNAGPAFYSGGMAFGQLQSEAHAMGMSKPKPLNLPAWRKVAIDMEHISSGHMEGGSRVSPNKGLFPSDWSTGHVEYAIRQAYRYGERINSQGDRVLVTGVYDGLRIDMWVNRSTYSIETAYPVR